MCSKLAKLRALMKDTKYVPKEIAAYVIPSEDAHFSEYVGECDQRRAFISGFTGSAGTAVVTSSSAALWTDGRYHLQASQQLSADWTLMKDGVPGVPSIVEWLGSVVPSGGYVGADPHVVTTTTWKSMRSALKARGCELISVNDNLVDLVWGNERPARQANPLITISVSHAGVTFEDKVNKVREILSKEAVNMLVVTALDDIAWLFNLRGSDVSYVPVFFSFAIITGSEVHFFCNSDTNKQEIKDHLQGKVIHHAYEDIDKVLDSLVSSHPNERVWMDGDASWFLVNKIPKKNCLIKSSPIAKLKAVKTKEEINSMREAHLIDAVALSEYLCWLEENVSKKKITEVSGAAYLDNLRTQLKSNMGLSFPSISSSGPNGAVIHYRPAPETDLPITTDDVYLIDSGGHYMCGTTDITRTVHFGTPSVEVKRNFTLVLKGYITLNNTIFPSGLNGSRLDSITRQALWRDGLDYAHGTGHGVGCFLSVHEGPYGISGARLKASEFGLTENMIVTIEPGYYKDGHYGLRVENVVLVAKANTPNRFRDNDFLTFEPITFVPIQTKMIQIDLLTAEEIKWINDYNKKCFELVSPLCNELGKAHVVDWLKKQSEPIHV